MKYTLILFLFMTILITGCMGNISTPTPAASLTPEATFTAEPLSTSTATSPSPTLNPTQRVVSTLVRSTLVARSTQSAATDQAYNSLVTEFSDVCQSVNSSLSPTGIWLAMDCPFERDFRVINHDKSGKIFISYDALFKDEVYFNKTAYISPLFWSRDRLYLFFIKQACCDHVESLSNSGPLYRLNLKNDAWQEIIPGYYNYFSFAPSRNIFAHIPDDVSGSSKPLALDIVDVNTLQKKSLPLTGFEQAGFIVWERNADGIVMMAKTGNNADGSEKFSVVIVDLITATIKPIIINSKYPVVPLDWSSKNVITIRRDPCSQDQADSCMSEFLYYDIKLGKMIFQPQQ